MSNWLSPAQLERLAILQEEMCEAGQIIQKIVRHGYESYDPTIEGDFTTNRQLLEKELGHVLSALDRLDAADEVIFITMDVHAKNKAFSAQPYLHHQPDDFMSRTFSLTEQSQGEPCSTL